MHCRQCGHDLHGASRCPNCGAWQGGHHDDHEFDHGHHDNHHDNHHNDHHDSFIEEIFCNDDNDCCDGDDD